MKLLRVKNIKDLQRVLNTFSTLVITKSIDPQTANCLIKILNLQLKTIKTSNLEKRILELEEIVVKIIRR